MFVFICYVKNGQFKFLLIILYVEFLIKLRDNLINVIVIWIFYFKLKLNIS